MRKQSVEILTTAQARRAGREEYFRQQAVKLAKEDADKANIETTSEGRSYLKARYEYHLKRLQK